MSLHHRFQHAMASVWLASHKKRDNLAMDLRAKLQLPDNVDLGPTVTRFVNFELTKSGHLAPMRLVFWEDIVFDDYPLYVLSWWEEAYKSYDLDSSSTKREKANVRTLIAEAEMLFGNVENDAKYSRLNAASELMLGLAVALQRRTIGADIETVKKGIAHLEKAIRLFGHLKPDETALSASDLFHIANAIHMADWLLSELEDDAFRKRTLQRLYELSAVSAYAWLAKVSGNWVYAYNVAEIYGLLGNQAAELSLLHAIELNPRLADFDLETKFDGIEEPLSEAPALREVLPKLSQKHSKWLEERVTIYRENESIYREDQMKGIRAMLKQVKLESPNDAKTTWKQRLMRAIPFAMGFGAGATLFLDTIAAFAKPIF